MPSLLERSDRESSMETHSGGGKKSSSHDVAGGEPVKHGQVRLSESSAGDEEESGGRKYHPKSSPTSQLLQVCSIAEHFPRQIITLQFLWKNYVNKCE